MTKFPWPRSGWGALTDRRESSCLSASATFRTGCGSTRTGTRRSTFGSSSSVRKDSGRHSGTIQAGLSQNRPACFVGSKCSPTFRRGPCFLVQCPFSAAPGTDAVIKWASVPGKGPSSGWCNGPCRSEKGRTASPVLPLHEMLASRARQHKLTYPSNVGSIRGFKKLQKNKK